MITGASSGIGRGWRSRSLHVVRVLVYWRAGKNCSTRSQPKSKHGMRRRSLSPLTCVMRTPSNTLPIVSANELGPIDILIANAGIGTADHAVQLKPEHVANVIGINVLGAVNSVAAVCRRWWSVGRVVWLRSRVLRRIAVWRSPRPTAQARRRFPLTLKVCESICVTRGVDVTIIHPGFIKTDLTAGREAKMPYLMELDDGS